MRITRIAPLALILFVAAACATSVRAPVDTVRPGTYHLVEPTPDEYTVVAINEGAFSVRVGDRTWTGQHWLDGDGRYHMVDDSGECAGLQSVWDYQVTGDRVTLNLIRDECPTREFAAQRLVYERR